MILNSWLDPPTREDHLSWKGKVMAIAIKEADNGNHHEIKVFSKRTYAIQPHKTRNMMSNIQIILLVVFFIFFNLVQFCPVKILIISYS